MDELNFELKDLNDVSAYQGYEQEREENEVQRIANENERLSNETLRETQESTRQSNESLRESQEQSRENAEKLRIQAETERSNAETLRESSETTRIQNEQERETAESSRVEAEKQRATAEANRINLENVRVTAEATRETQEATRETNETSRISAEQTRVNQENARQQYYQEIQNKVDNGEFNGRGIVNTERVSSVAGVDTYHINYTDGQNPDEFTVTNGTGSGDMETDVYDTNKNGIVDNAEKLNNQTSDYYLNYNNFTNKPTIPTTTNELTNNSDFTTKNYVDTTFETKNNASQTYATKNEVSSTYATKNEVSSTYATKNEVSSTYATKTEATYTSENTDTIDVTLSNRQISASLKNNSVSETKLSTELANKINGKQDSSSALFFSVEEEIEEE